MIVVISCAGSKSADASRLRTPDGKPVSFVAHPEQQAESRRDPGVEYVHPDAESGFGGSWREKLADYNQEHLRTGGNPHGLLPAHRLYKNRIYRDLVEKFSAESVFILSAGWGLIRSDFLTPQYDITFSGMAPDAERRDYSRDAGFRDINALRESPGAGDGPILCMAGKDYLPLFGDLVASIDCDKPVFFTTKEPPELPGCRPVRYARGGMNWQYKCARDLIDGTLEW